MRTKDVNPVQGELLEILDPVGEAPSVSFDPAPRLDEFASAKIGYLDNNKWNVEPLLRSIHGRLEETWGTPDMVYVRKRLFSQPAPPETYDLIEREAEAAIVAIGD